MRENMAWNRVAILPDLTHWEISAPVLAHAVLPFLNGASGPGTWRDQVRGAC